MLIPYKVEYTLPQDIPGFKIIEKVFKDYSVIFSHNELLTSWVPEIQKSWEDSVHHTKAFNKVKDTLEDNLKSDDDPYGYHNPGISRRNDAKINNASKTIEKVTEATSATYTCAWVIGPEDLPIKDLIKDFILSDELYEISILPWQGKRITLTNVKVPIGIGIGKYSDLGYSVRNSWCRIKAETLHGYTYIHYTNFKE